MAYAASAYITLLWAVLCYASGVLPLELLGRADKTLLKANSRRAETRWAALFQRVTLILSDQQIITGIGILLAGFINLSSGLSAYHWQVLVYTAWMSSNVHLTTLSLLRGWFRDRPSLSHWRVVGMLVLLLMLLVALVPMTTDAWTVAALSNYPVAIGKQLDWSVGPYPGYGIPARCFWPLTIEYAGRSISADACLSYVILILSYAWKVGQLHGHTAHRLKTWVRTKPTEFLIRKATDQLQKAQRGVVGSKITYRLILLVMVPFVAWFEFVETFVASLWLLTFGLVWASVAVFSPRQYVDSTVLDQENEWGIGQVIPLMLLLLPVATVLEEIYGTVSLNHLFHFGQRLTSH